MADAGAAGGPRGGPYKSYVFWNNKGGVGKTSLAYNFAMEMAMEKRNKNILCIDMDAQANLTSLLLGGGVGGAELASKMSWSQPIRGSWPGDAHDFSALERADGSGLPKPTIKTYFKKIAANRGGAPRLEELMIKQNTVHPLAVNDPRQRLDAEGRRVPYPDMYTSVAAPGQGLPGDVMPAIPSNTYFIPGDVSLDFLGARMEALINFPDVPGEETSWQRACLSLKNDIREQLDESWIVVIDCNPSLSLFTQIALLAADELLIPCLADDFSSGGLRNLLTQTGIINFSHLPDLVDPPESWYDELTSRHAHARSMQKGAHVEFPEPAKLRAIVVNRIPTNNQRKGGQLEFAKQSLRMHLARGWAANPGRFALPHDVVQREAMAGVADADRELSREDADARRRRDERLDEWVTRHHYAEMDECRAVMDVVTSIGIPVTSMNGSNYHDPWIAGSELPVRLGEREDDNVLDKNWATGTARQAVGVGLQVQDLVRLCLDCSHLNAVSGHIGKRKPWNGPDWNYSKKDILVAPGDGGARRIFVPTREDRDRPQPGMDEPDQRNGRRMLPMEFELYKKMGDETRPVSYFVPTGFRWKKAPDEIPWSPVKDTPAFELPAAGPEPDAMASARGAPRRRLNNS